MSEKSVCSSRSRGPNFTKAEQFLLFSVMEPYTFIIECKKTDAVKQVDKQNAWSKIAQVFNANTKGVSRSTDNLIACYRNVKSKIKKQRSEAKMLLQDSTTKQALVTAIDENGKEWDVVSKTINEPVAFCKAGFEELKKEIKKKEIASKNVIMGTGGGPPLNDSAEDPVLKLKKYIEPQIDGLFTMYDGDTQLLTQFQQTLPESERIQPIEKIHIQESENEQNKDDDFLPSALPSAQNDIIDIKEDLTQTPFRCVENIIKKPDMLRKKRASELICGNAERAKKRKTTNEAIRDLSEEKLELVKMQKALIAMEIEHKKKMYDLELSDKIKENEHKEKVRALELQYLGNRNK